MDHVPEYLSSPLTGALARYTEGNPQSRTLHNESTKYLPGGNTRTVLHGTPFPLTFESGYNQKLRSVDGIIYTDLLNEYSAGIFGHSNIRINQAIHDALRHGWNFGGQSRYEKQFAAQVVDRYRPAGMEMLRFANSGTEANTMALAAAIAFTGRRKILVFSSAYHGGTLTFPMDLITDPKMLSPNLPHDFVYAPFNNIEETKQIVAALPDSSLAAILVEAVQGAGGARPAASKFLHFLRSLANDHGAILIADEVMTSRLGFSGCMAEHGIQADMVTLGKYVAGGMTFGAFGGRNDIMALFDPNNKKLQHSGTYNNNIVSMAAGIEALAILDAGTIHALNQRGDRLRKDLNDLLIQNSIISGEESAISMDRFEVDSFSGPTQHITDSGTSLEIPCMFIMGRGSLLNIRFSGPLNQSWYALFWHHCLRAGFYLAPRGFITLSIELTEDDLNDFVSCVEEFVLAHREHLTLQ